MKPKRNIREIMPPWVWYVCLALSLYALLVLFLLGAFGYEVAGAVRRSGGFALSVSLLMQLYYRLTA